MLGTTVKTTRGQSLRILSFLDSGGQGRAYEARDAAGQRRVVKVMNPGLATPATRQRIRRLIELDLPSLSPAFGAPIDMLVGSELGHVCAHVGSKSLEEVLQSPGDDYALETGLFLASQLCSGVATLEALGVAHGDHSPTNIRYDVVAGVPRLWLIDLDNANLGPGLPPPGAVGQVLYMAPELRIPFERKQPVPAPTIYSDRFALMAIVHELLLLRPLVQADDAQRFFASMTSDCFPGDPLLTRGPTAATGGLPQSALDANLLNTFRRAFAAPTPEERPSAADWVTVLNKSLLTGLFECSRCSGQTVIEATKTRCPYCVRDYPHLVLRTATTTLSLRQPSTLIGRALLPGPDVSARHAVIRRIGPETYLTDRSTNGTFRRAGNQWVRLAPGVEHLIQPGDRLRFGSVEATVVEDVA